MASNLLSEVPSENYFGFSDGRIAKSLEDLFNILSTSDPAFFSEHVGDSKDDFSSWIRTCVLHIALADKLSATKNRDEYLRILGGEIQNLKMGSPPTVPADDGLGSIDAELNSVLDEEILAAMNDDAPADTGANSVAQAVQTSAAQVQTPVVSQIATQPAMAQTVIPATSAQETVVEESYEYEEVFKPLIDSLAQEIFTWEG
jgi:hypothetical protein